MTTVKSITGWAKDLYPTLDWDIISIGQENKMFLQAWTLNRLDYAEEEITYQVMYSGYGELINKVANEVINKSYKEEFMNAK